MSNGQYLNVMTCFFLFTLQRFDCNFHCCIVMRFQTAAEALDSLERGVVKGEELDLVVAEVPPANTEMDTFVVFHHILDALEVPFVTMCAYDDIEAVSEHTTLGSCFNVLKPFGTETVNILLHKALQHKSKRGLPEGSSILKKTQGRMNSSSTKNHGSKTGEDEPDVFKAHGRSKKPCRFTWSSRLLEKFLRAVEVLGESATPRNIRQHMNVKISNLTLDHISSHLQKHRLREQRSKHVAEVYQKRASMEKLSGLITSVQNAATPKPINRLTTTEMRNTHGVSSATWDKHPGKLWAQVEESPAEAAVLKTNARTSAVPKRCAKSLWDKYEESLEFSDESPPERLSMTYQRKLLPVKSKAIDEYGGIADISPTADGSDCTMTSLLQQLKETSRTEAAGNNVNLESAPLQACYTMNQVHTVNLQKGTMSQAQAAVNLQKDVMNQVQTAVALRGNAMSGVHAAAMVAGGVVDLGSKVPLGGTGNNRYTAERTPSDPFSSWEEVEAFWMSHLEGLQQQVYGPDEMLQVDDAWNQALQQANVDVAPVAQTLLLKSPLLVVLLWHMMLSLALMMCRSGSLSLQVTTMACRSCPGTEITE
uniref:Uncharacterized protein n=1 Tax=Avena sativa TaxID=4498 RepID=A0ACD6A762_AVESA